MITAYVINVQFIKQYLKEDVYAKETMSETQHLDNVNFHVLLVNLNIKEGVLSAL